MYVPPTEILKLLMIWLSERANISKIRYARTKLKEIY